MSMGATPDTAIPHDQAWPREKRLELMRDIVRLLASKVPLRIENAPAFAQTYGVAQAEVEAEFLKYPKEDCAK